MAFKKKTVKKSNQKKSKKKVSKIQSKVIELPPKAKSLVDHKKEPREYVDEMHSVMDLYYEILEESHESIKGLELKMNTLIKKDPHFLDPYLILYDAFNEDEEYELADHYLDTAFKHALELILDDQGFWPDRLEWGWLENRHIIRTLHNKALALWSKREITMALYIFKKILIMNPNDNSGVRYPILGIYFGMTCEEFEDFSEDDRGFMNPKIDVWFEKGIKKFSKEFKALGWDE